MHCREISQRRSWLHQADVAEKTRLIEFGRFAAERRARRGLGKPETFNSA
jgi:RNA-directed DNA polymerase